MFYRTFTATSRVVIIQSGRKKSIFKVFIVFNNEAVVYDECSLFMIYMIGWCQSS